MSGKKKIIELETDLVRRYIALLLTISHDLVYIFLDLCFKISTSYTGDVAVTFFLTGW